MYLSEGRAAFVPFYSVGCRQPLHISAPPALTSVRSLSTTTTLNVSSNIPDDLPLVPFAAIAAIILLITAQSWINFLLKGDRGLGAFLSDGSGFNKSGFKPSKAGDDNDMEDPMPWLKLPQFDYVDVAGQPKSSIDGEVVSQMEEMKEQIKVNIDAGDMVAAKQIEMELESLMQKEGYEFTKSFE